VKKEFIALDTNIVIDVLNGEINTIQCLKNYQKIYLPITVCGELLFGAKNSAKHEENEEKFRQFLQSCFILNINSLVADTYAEVRKSLKDKGTPLPENDIWIAATCLVNDLPLATHDKHFEKVEGLRLITIEKNL